MRTGLLRGVIARLVDDPLLGRFWQHRGTDGLQREKQLLIDFLCRSAGGPLYYTGRDLKTTHVGDAPDWALFISHLRQTLKKFDVPVAETEEVLAFVENTRADIVEA